MKSTTRGIKIITLIEDDKQRIYEPWKCSIIVKLFGKRILHQFLKQIQELCLPTDDFSLIDLGEDYYIIKFKKKKKKNIWRKLFIKARGSGMAITFLLVNGS